MVVADGLSAPPGAPIPFYITPSIEVIFAGSLLGVGIVHEPKILTCRNNLPRSCGPAPEILPPRDTVQR